MNGEDWKDTHNGVFTKEALMKSIDELVYYCNEPDPVGALMLTGEWGCGKTFLIELELKEKLKDRHIFVRVSLFGLNPIWLLGVERF